MRLPSGWFRPRLVVRLGRVLALCGLLIALAATGLFAARDEWRYARTDNFEVLSAASEKKTRQLVAELEQFRASFIATFGLRPAHEPRVTVLLFNSDRAFTPYKPTYKGRPKEVSGFFVGGSDEVVIALNLAADADEDGDPAETIFHEYVHLLFHTRGLHLPTWLNEGLAELFSTFRVNGNVVEYGRPKQLYVDVLNLSAMMPMPRLMAVTESSPDYNEEHRAGMFYAQSWALAHFLVCGENRGNAVRLSRFIEAIDGSGVNPDATFREIFGKDFNTLEQNLRQYLQGGRYYQRRVPAPLKDFAGKVTLRAATESERDFALLNLRWRVHRSGDTMLAALQLAEKYPSSPRPHELFAAVAAADGDAARALDRWRQAAERQSENPFVLVQGARAKLIDLGFEADLDTRLPEAELVQLRLWLDRAVARAPHYDDAMELLALVESRSPEFRIPAINQIQARVNQMKDPNPTLLALAVIRWRAKDIATAGSITKAVLESSRARADTKAEARLLQLRFSDSAEVTARQPSTRAARSTVPSIRDRAGFSAGNDGGSSEATRAGFPLSVGGSGTFVDRLDPASNITRLSMDETPLAGANLDDTVRQLRELEGKASGGPTLPPISDDSLRERVAAAVARGGDAALVPVFRSTPNYPLALRAAGVTGEARVQCRVDATGHPRDVKITSATHPAFGEAAETCVWQWRFIPMIKDGKAVSVTTEIPFLFGLDRQPR